MTRAAATRLRRSGDPSQPAASMFATASGTSTARSMVAVWVGLTGGAGERSPKSTLPPPKTSCKYSDIEDTGLGLFTRSAGGTRLASRSSTSGRSGLEWRQLIRGGGDQPGEGERWNMVRYDTPEIFGFVGYGGLGRRRRLGRRACGTPTTSSTASRSPLASPTAKIPKSFGRLQLRPCAWFPVPRQQLSGALVATGIPDTKCSQLGGSSASCTWSRASSATSPPATCSDDAMKTDPGFTAFNSG